MHQLPFELLIKILVELRPEDLCNIELVSRQWNRCCAENIWKAYFNNRWGYNKFTPLKLRSKNSRRCESGEPGGSHESSTHEPFTWKKQVMARYHAIESWRKTRVPTVSYRIAEMRSFQSAVNWQQGILLEVSDSTNDQRSIHHLYDGSYLKGSPDGWCHHPHGSFRASPFGILDMSSRTYMNTRHEVYHVHSRGLHCAWLSSTSAATSPIGITIVAIAIGRVLFFANLNLVGYATYSTVHTNRYLDAKEIHPLNEDEFLILTHSAVYRVSIGKFEFIFNARADRLHVADPFVFTSGIHGLQRVNLETKEKTVLTSVPVSQCTHDDNIIVAYTVPDQMLRAWATSSLAASSDRPIWSMPTPLSTDYYYSITSMALNAVVLVCGGYKGVSCVIDVLTGEIVAFKKAKRVGKPPRRIEGDGISRPLLPVGILKGIQSIHLGPACEAQMVLVFESTVTVYDATRSRLPAESKPAIKNGPELKEKPITSRKMTCDLDYDPEDVYDDYRAVNMIPDTLEKEQLDIALALSLS